MNAWTKLGLHPVFNKKELGSSPQIKHEMTIDEHGNPDTNKDPEAAYLKSIIETNHLCCGILESGGYGSDLLRVTPSITPRNDQRKARITQPHTREQQDILTNSKSQGENPDGPKEPVCWSKCPTKSAPTALPSTRSLGSVTSVLPVKFKSLKLSNVN